MEIKPIRKEADYEEALKIASSTRPISFSPAARQGEPSERCVALPVELPMRYQAF